MQGVGSCAELVEDSDGHTQIHSSYGSGKPLNDLHKVLSRSLRQLEFSLNSLTGLPLAEPLPGGSQALLNGHRVLLVILGQFSQRPACFT